MVFKKDVDCGIFFIFIAAFLIRALYIFQILWFPLTEFLIRSDVFDQYTYNTTAIKISQGAWIGGSDVFTKEPLYPYFLAIVYKIFGYNHIPVYLIQALLTSLGALFLYKIVGRFFNRITGYISSFIFSFYSVSIYYDALLLRESLITSLGIYLLYSILKADNQPRPRLWLIAGFILGVLMLVRHNMLLFFIIIYILAVKRPFKKAILYGSVFIAGFSIVILPVLLRNYIVSDYKHIGISKEVNAFWVGNNPASSGVDVDWSSEYHYLNDNSGGSITRTIAIFLQEVRAKPFIYARLYLRKIWMFFNSYEAPSNTNYYLYREEFPTLLRWPLFNFQFVCSLGILGLWLSLFATHKPWMAYIFLFSLSFSVILFHIQDRFRLNVVPFFIVFASYSIYFIIENIRKRRYVKGLAVIITFLFLFIIFKPDLTYGGFRPERDKIRPVDRTNLALSYIDAYSKQKNDDLLKLAMRQCILSAKEERDFSITHRIKGHIYYLETRFMDSINEYKKAIIYDNRDPFLYNNLAGVYYAQKAYQKSFLYTKRALNLFRGHKLFKQNLSIIPL